MSSRQSSIEHLWGYADAMQVPGSPVRGQFDLEGRLQAMKHLDESKMAPLANATREAGVWNCVTMIVQHNWSTPARARTLLGRPEMRYVPPSRLAEWRNGRRANLSESEAELERLRHEFHKRMTKVLRDAGARLLLGTDTGNPMVLEGFSIHEELQYLVDAGLTPYEAIKTGTYDAAEFLGGLKDFGTVAVGRRADLVLVDGNPLERVSHLQKRAGVMLRGRWMPAAELQKRLDGLAASYGGTR